MGVKDIIAGIFSSTVTGAVDSLAKSADTFIQTKDEKATFQLEVMRVKMAMKDQELDAVDKAREFALAYEGSAKDVPKWILIMRSVIRPLVTLSMFLSFLVFLGMDIRLVIKGQDMFILKALPTQYWTVLNIVLLFWFGGKIGENIVDKVKGNK